MRAKRLTAAGLALQSDCSKRYHSSGIPKLDWHKSLNMYGILVEARWTSFVIDAWVRECSAPFNGSKADDPFFKVWTI